MSSKLQFAVKSILAGTALTLLSAGAFAAGAVGPKTATSWNGNNDVLGAQSSISTVATGVNKNSWTDNNSTSVGGPFVLANAAWGHTGTWWTFDVTAANQNVDVKATLLSGNANLAFTVWSSGASAFNGGTTAPLEQGTLTGFNTPHDFNQVGQLGSAGTVWATDPSVNAAGGGNLLSTLAYVNSGVAHSDPTQNDWGLAINGGVNQVDYSGAFFSGAVGGNATANAVDLQFHNLATGWYTVFVGGANSANTVASTYQLTVSSVPLPGAVYMFGSALAGLAISARRKLRSA